MYLSRGLYVFLNKNTIRRFMYDGDEATELPEITFEHQLIDFLEIDLTPFNRLLDKLKAYTKENTPPYELLGVCRAVGYTAEIFCQEEPVYSFLLCTKLYVDSYDVSSYKELFEYKDRAVEMLRDVTDCRCDCLVLLHKLVQSDRVKPSFVRQHCYLVEVTTDSLLLLCHLGQSVSHHDFLID